MKSVIILSIIFSFNLFSNYQEVNTLRNEINKTTNSNLKLYKSTYHDLSKEELEKLDEKLKSIHAILKENSEKTKY